MNTFCKELSPKSSFSYVIVCLTLPNCTELSILYVRTVTLENVQDKYTEQAILKGRRVKLA